MSLEAPWHDLTGGGPPGRDDRDAFALLTFLVFQTIIGAQPVKKRWGGIRTAFHDFEPAQVLRLDPHALLHQPGMIPNAKKIAATQRNARTFVALREQYGSFRKYLEHFEGDLSAIASDLDDRLAYVGRPSILAFLKGLGYPVVVTERQGGGTVVPPPE